MRLKTPWGSRRTLSWANLLPTRFPIPKGLWRMARWGGEGSTNWSTSGEGTFVVAGKPGGVGYKAQNNTQTIFTDTDALARFQAELLAEHLAAAHGTQPG